MEPHDQHQPIHRVPVNGSSMILRFFLVKLEQIYAVECCLYELGPCPRFGHLIYLYLFCKLNSGSSKIW